MKKNRHWMLYDFCVINFEIQNKSGYSKDDPNLPNQQKQGYNYVNVGVGCASRIPECSGVCHDIGFHSWFAK